jgi:class 3 adenylate cyclase/predicted ATPase
MTFEEILDHAMAMLQRRGRVAYRTLKRQFNLDDDALEDLKTEIIKAQRLAVDEDGEVLIWTGEAGAPPRAPVPPQPVPQAGTHAGQPRKDVPPRAAPPSPDAERRQLTVLFCDLVDSTVLASQLDPEEWREVVRAYQATCAEVIEGLEGHIAQYLGDGLLVYFGYPLAHEDDAQRAVRTGLDIVEAMDTLNSRLGPEKGVRLAVRVGIHTGLVVVGAMGGRGRQEQLALGDTPNIAARLQGLAAPDTVLISAATQQLIQGYFTCHALGSQTLKGVATPLQIHQVMRATEVQHRLDVATARGLTPLVGREHEVGLLRERWAQVQAGQGHIVVLSGEAGIGKSRLVQVMKDEIIGAAALRIEYRCSPYHQHSALSPVIVHLERVLAFRRDDTPEDKLRKLEEAIRSSPLPLAEVVPLFAALLSVPLPESYPPLTLTPQRQKQKTLEALLTWLLVLTERQPVLFVVEDLHWSDPSTLELLTLFLDQVPTARLLILLTCRPEFLVPWTPRGSLTQLTLGRLGWPQVEAMVTSVLHGKAMPSEVVAQIVAKTDGVPLFVEELTKMVLESGLLQEREERYELTGPLPPLAIPATLHDSLMARLDRLTTVKAAVQLGATIGRQFSYELLQAVAPLDEAALQHSLRQLVEAEIVYQRGVGSQALYTFKHALIQDAAYQSLLKSTRQQYHQRIAQVLEARFAQTAETQPELLAHHYTEAGLSEQAISYWQRAGRQAARRSAHVEAIAHLTKGLELLLHLPETPARAQAELTLQIALGASLVITQGYTAPTAERAYARARVLCHQVGDVAQLSRVLFALWGIYANRAEHRTARELGAELLTLAQRLHNPTTLLVAHHMMGSTWYWLGELTQARDSLEHALALEAHQPQARDAAATALVARVTNYGYTAWTLWLLGYPEQAQQRNDQALALAHALAHPFSQVVALLYAAMFHLLRREGPAAQERAETELALATAQGFPFWVAGGTIVRGWALATQGQTAEGIAQMRQGITAWRALGASVVLATYLATLAEVCGQVGQLEDAQHLLREAQTLVDSTGERYWEAEVYRLQGELLVQASRGKMREAAEHFHQALDIARRQQAKSLELRAAMSLSRLWQQQGKRDAAHELLAPIYGWFTEGFDTADLKEAKALLEELSSS